jgi:hypothetical protein
VSSVPHQVRIRSYNVGFGDCFLLTFSYPRRGPSNVLIDFGSTKASSYGPRGLLPIAKQIASDCGGKLQMVVATHRHADHISGFAGEPGAVIASLAPDLVVQPWTEDPNLEPDAQGAPASGEAGRAARSFVGRLVDMQAVAAAVVAEVPRLEKSRAVPKSVAAQVRFLGETNLANSDSVTNLMTMGKLALYVNFGTKLPTKRLLPGIGIDVLGPPTLRQSKAIADEARVDRDEFWHLAALRGVAGASKARRPRPIFPNAPKAKRFQQEARWVIPRIDKLNAEELLAIVRILDDALNNTSVILLFEIGETLLLFPGDAQIENWDWSLKLADDHEAIRQKLARTRFYKVGHHGSLNATPKTLWNGFEHRSNHVLPDRLVTMVSTLSGKHGSAARGTEVPRAVLVDELKRMSDFHDTRNLRSKKVFWNDVVLDLSEPAP